MNLSTLFTATSQRAPYDQVSHESKRGRRIEDMRKHDERGD